MKIFRTCLYCHRRTWPWQRISIYYCRKECQQRSNELAELWSKTMRKYFPDKRATATDPLPPRGSFATFKELPGKPGPAEGLRRRSRR